MRAIILTAQEKIRNVLARRTVEEGTGEGNGRQRNWGGGLEGAIAKVAESAENFVTFVIFCDTITVEPRHA